MIFVIKSYYYENWMGKSFRIGADEVLVDLGLCPSSPYYEREMAIPDAYVATLDDVLASIDWWTEDWLPHLDSEKLVAMLEAEKIKRKEKE